MAIHQSAHTAIIQPTRAQLSPSILALAAAKDVWVGDRNFCTTTLLMGFASRGAFFAIRHHAGMTLTSTGTRRARGRTETGEVYEEGVTLTDSDGATLRLRRVTVRLDKKTRDGDLEVAILTNLPVKVASALTVANLYRNRWTLESMFLKMTQILEGEIGALGYPGAALLGFGVALVSYNIYSTVQAALRAEFGVEKVQQDVSGYYIADEVQSTMRGMEVAVEPILWQAFQTMSPKELARDLRRCARHVSLELYKKHPPRAEEGTNSPHQVCRSAARLHRSTPGRSQGNQVTLKAMELLAYYLGQSSTTSAYGAAGSFFVVLLWVYYSSLILFIGAELTQAFVTQMGHPLAPDEHARMIKTPKEAAPA